MLLAAPIIILCLTVLVMLVVRLLRAEFAYHWLIATIGAFIAWPLTFILGTQLPRTAALIIWEPESIFPASPVLIMDQISWPYAVGVVTLILVMMMTDVARASESMWSDWAAGLLLGALGVFAVIAGNPLTLLMAWAAIDLVELFVLFVQPVPAEMRERLVVAYSIRIFASGLLLVVVLLNDSLGLDWSVDNFSTQSAVLLLLAVGLRVGVLPAYMPLMKRSASRRGLGTIVLLVSAAACLVLLNRTSLIVQESTLINILLIIVGVIAIYAATAWVFAEDELSGAPAWVLGMASLSAAAAMLAQPAASQAWGITVLLAGGLIFFTSVLERRMSWLLIFGLIGISSLPLTPTWNGALMYSSPFKPVMVIFIIVQVVLVVGFLRHILRPRPGLSGVERWVWLIYPLGLAILPVVHFLYGWWAFIGFGTLTTSSWWLGLVIVLLTGLVVGLVRFGPRVSIQRTGVLKEFFSMQWFYRLMWGVFGVIENIIRFITTILEGEGGLLWAFLMLVILFMTFVALFGGV